MDQTDVKNIDIIINKSRTYLLPIFNFYVPIQYTRLLVNTYLWYDDLLDETYCLLYKFDGRVKGDFKNRQGFVVYENRILENSRYYLGSRDFGKYVFYQFQLPDEMYEVRDYFLSGRYSRFEPDMQEMVREWTHKYYGVNESEYIKRVFEKDFRLRKQLEEEVGQRIPEDAELSSIPDIKLELFSTHVNFKEEEEQKQTKDEPRYLL